MVMDTEVYSGAEKITAAAKNLFLIYALWVEQSLKFALGSLFGGLMNHFAHRVTLLIFWDERGGYNWIDSSVLIHKTFCFDDHHQLIRSDLTALLMVFAMNDLCCDRKFAPMA